MNGKKVKILVTAVFEFTVDRCEGDEEELYRKLGEQYVIESCHHMPEIKSISVTEN